MVKRFISLSYPFQFWVLNSSLIRPSSAMVYFRQAKQYRVSEVKPNYINEYIYVREYVRLNEIES